MTQIIEVMGSDGSLCLLAVIVAGLVSFVATPAARALALAWDVVDSPGGRRVHTKHTARLGGLAVLSGILAGVGLSIWVAIGLTHDPELTYAVIPPILAIAAFVCMFGALDDMLSISATGKICGLTVASVLLIAFGIRIDFVNLPGFGGIELGWFAVPATIVWVLACTNAVNLIDGVDGAGAGVSMISACSMMLLALGLGDSAAGILFAATCGAAAGFLIHNKQPASIFLGDSGSLLLGFMLAATSAAACTKGATSLTLVGALLALAVPFLDAGQSFVRRFRAALRPLGARRLMRAIRATAVADQGHIHHRLLIRGLSHRQVSLALYLVTSVTGLAILLLLPNGSVPRWATVATLVVGAFALYRLGSVKTARDDALPGEVPPPTGGPQGMGEPGPDRSEAQPSVDPPPENAEPTEAQPEHATAHDT